MKTRIVLAICLITISSKAQTLIPPGFSFHAVLANDVVLTQDAQRETVEFVVDQTARFVGQTVFKQGKARISGTTIGFSKDGVIEVRTKSVQTGKGKVMPFVGAAYDVGSREPGLQGILVDETEAASKGPSVHLQKGTAAVIRLTAPFEVDG